ncbi:MAG: transposase [Deltaproteobacteria bacterium]|nr:transposase [Deltaproteobacteria bacterium]
MMRRMDKLHLKHPFFGSRMMTQTLKREGLVVNRKRVQRLMRIMGLESTAPKPNTSKPAPEHAVYPYLLRDLKVSRINQVWAADITTIPMAHSVHTSAAGTDRHGPSVCDTLATHPATPKPASKGLSVKTWESCHFGVT